ncbi:MAG: hypothetical protein GF334_12310 [Candidatus Altiarchaeales archaeon]|nr:hypothetical protein [Candidatus Altiarchaeales archaeon]
MQAPKPRRTDSKKDLPDLLEAQSDEQVVFLKKTPEPVVIGRGPVSGPVAATKGGIGYVVGGAQSDFHSPDDRAKKLIQLQQQGVLVAKTPQEIYDEGVFGDKKKLAMVFTSGGEGSTIGVNLSTVTQDLGQTHVVLGAWQGFKAGVKPQDEFKTDLVVLNDPNTIKRMAETGGSPLGMSRTKLKPGSPQEDQLFDNVKDLGMVFGTGGGDHSRNFLALHQKAEDEGSDLTVAVTPKSMDNDLSIKLKGGETKNSLMLGFLTAAHTMRRHWFDEFQSAAGSGRWVVGFFFGRGAGWTVLGATRCDAAYRQQMKKEGILDADLENKMDALGGKQIALVPEKMVTIPEFVGEVNRINSQGRDSTGGVAVSEGFMFREMSDEYKRLLKQKENGELNPNDVMAKAAEGDLEDLIKDKNLNKVFKAKPDIAKEFFGLVLKPETDVWGNPKMTVMPKVVDAVVNVLTDVKKTNYTEIKYEARTAKATPRDEALGRATGQIQAQMIRQGRSGLTTVLCAAGEDPMLIDPEKRGATFTPFEEIEAMSEKENTLQQFSDDYLRKLGVFTGGCVPS